MYQVRKNHKVYYEEYIVKNYPPQNYLIAREYCSSWRKLVSRYGVIPWSPIV